MRHLKKGRQIGSDAAHGNAILRSLALALLTHERIKTTEMRAKEVRGLVDRSSRGASRATCTRAG